MTDTPDHIAGLRKFADHLRDQDDRPMFAAAMDMHIDALEAERDALRTYAEWLERILRPETIQQVREEHGVAAILADD